MSEEGRRQFVSFPDMVADDLFMHAVFGPNARISVLSCSSVVQAPASLRGLIERKTRTFAGNLQLRQAPGIGGATKADSIAWARVAINEPRLVRDVPVYLFVTLLAKMRARRRMRRDSWGAGTATNVLWSTTGNYRAALNYQRAAF